MKSFITIDWIDNKVIILDQRKLPDEVIYHYYSEPEQVVDSIKEMIIRGAPAIGIAAAMGIALAANNSEKNRPEFDSFIKKYAEIFRSARPTAVNLSWGIERMLKLLIKYPHHSASELKDIFIKESKNILIEDIEINKKIGKNGQALLSDNSTVLTHCNAGALATGGYGTALGVIRAAVENGKKIKIFADETRPYLQGARLTSWELSQDDIDVTVITDNMAGFVMGQKKIDAIIVGADRIVKNGDTANKIGTYSLAILANYHKIPFYVAAPISTIDFNISEGKDIPIEQRDSRELTHINNYQIVPDNVNVYNPAFDVTPNNLITAIITEKGIIYPPFLDNIKLI